MAVCNVSIFLKSIVIEAIKSKYISPVRVATISEFVVMLWKNLIERFLMDRTVSQEEFYAITSIASVIRQVFNDDNFIYSQASAK